MQETIYHVHTKMRQSLVINTHLYRNTLFKTYDSTLILSSNFMQLPDIFCHIPKATSVSHIGKQMSHLMTKPTKWHVRPAKTQISLGLCPVWSASSLFMWRKLGSLISYPLSAQRRLWSDWVDAQADLSFRWVHMPFCWFCHEVAQIATDSDNYTPNYIESKIFHYKLNTSRTSNLFNFILQHESEFTAHVWNWMLQKEYKNCNIKGYWHKQWQVINVAVSQDVLFFYPEVLWLSRTRHLKYPGL